MCELFGYSGAREQVLEPWLTPFRLRGGDTGDNPDGWGVASWNERGVRLVKSPEPGHISPDFGRLATSLCARLVIGHVRKARHPPVPGMLNTHPFAHACCDRHWVFAHNGLVPEVTTWSSSRPVCQPVGSTDSEHAFCHLLSEIAGRYHADASDRWVGHLAELAERIAALGKFNFLLSDGHALIAYGHDRLHHLESADPLAPGVVLATEPLTDDPWQPFARGELRVYRDGDLAASVVPTA